MSAPDEWYADNICAYWSRDDDSIYIKSKKLAVLDEKARESALDAISTCVADRIGRTDNRMLPALALYIVDNLFKSAQRDPVLVDRATLDYLEASAGTAMRLFGLRGFLIHYLVNNTYEQTEKGMGRPLRLYEKWFQASGLIYICPQHIALDIMKMEGLDASSYFEELPRFIPTARDMAQELIQQCNNERHHYVILDTDGDKETFTDAMKVLKVPYTITMIREAAPLPGSSCAIICLDESGRNVMPDSYPG